MQRNRRGNPRTERQVMTYVKLEDAVKAVEAEYVDKDSEYEGDIAYNLALDHAVSALRSLPTGWQEARRRFEYASRQYHNTKDWYGEESPEAGKSLHDWFMEALGPLPAPPAC